MKKLILCLILANTLFADPYNFSPSGRAAGMGEAYTAIAADSSASFYNPAGTSALYMNPKFKQRGEMYFGVGYITQPIDSSDYMQANESAVNGEDIIMLPDVLLNFAILGPNLGLSYVETVMVIPDSTNKFLRVPIGSYGISYAPISWFSIGASMIQGPVFQNLVSILSSTDTSSSYNGTYNIGYKLLFLENRHLRATIGSSYRAMEKQDQYGSSEIETIDGTAFFLIPSRLSHGIAIDKFNSFGTITFAYDYIDVGYSETRHAIGSAFGAEVAFPQYILRAGYRHYTIGESATPETEDSISVGVLFQSNQPIMGFKQSIIELSAEKRINDFVTTQEENFLFSILVNFKMNAF